MSDLLLIDDDPGQLVTQVRQAFPAPGHRIAVARTGAEGVARVRTAPPDVVLLSLRLPDQCGLAVYRQIRGLDGQVPVIFVTKSREAKAAIEAMKRGAYDCLFKPPDPGHLAQVLQEALEIGRRLHEPSLTAEPAAAPETGGQLVGTCPAMRQVYKEIGLVAAQDFPVIITGESGTGKELVARASNQHSKRARRRDGVLPQGRLRAVVEYVEEHLDASPTLEQLAVVARLSPYHFARQFKTATGLPPHQFVILRRVERAKVAVRAGQQSAVSLTFPDFQVSGR